MSEIFLNDTIMSLHLVVLVQHMTTLLLSQSALLLAKTFMFIQFWKVTGIYELKRLGGPKRPSGRKCTSGPMIPEKLCDQVFW